MTDDRDDQLLEDAGDVYADWRVAGHQASDRQAFEKLCAGHPELAIYLERIRRLDAGTRKIAEEEGAAAGGRNFEEDDVGVRTAFGGGPRRPGKEAEQRARSMMDRVRRRSLSFGKYHLTGLTAEWAQLGKGGAGSVYRAWDEDLARYVALKLLHVRYVDPSSDVDPALRRRAQARFVHEAQLTAQLDHPGIVPLHDFGMTSTGRPYFTMKMVKGKTLGQIIELMSGRSPSWNLTRTLGVFLKASEALAYAHAKGIIHRDLKPANIMVGKYGEVLVMDWGLLKKVEREESGPSPAITHFADVPGGPEFTSAPLDGITDQGGALGTAMYMAPEQAVGDLDAVGRASDVYGLGAILYHILAGAPPFMGKGGSPPVHGILEAHRAGIGPPSIHKVAPGAPLELRRIVAKAMAHRPEDRHASVTDLGDEVLAFIEGRVGKEWVSSPFRSTVRWARHRPAAAALVAVSFALAAVLLYRRLSPAGPLVAPIPADQAVRAALARWVEEHGDEGLAEFLDLVGEDLAVQPRPSSILPGEIPGDGESR